MLSMPSPATLLASSAFPLFDSELDAALVLCKNVPFRARRLLREARANGGYTKPAPTHHGCARASRQRRGMLRCEIASKSPELAGIVVFFGKSVGCIHPSRLRVPTDMVQWITDNGFADGATLARQNNDETAESSLSLEAWWQLQHTIDGETARAYADRRYDIISRGVSAVHYRDTLPFRRRTRPWKGLVQSFFTGTAAFPRLSVASLASARRWYCEAYERAVMASPEARRFFGALASLMRMGYNVLMRGRNGRPLNPDTLRASFEADEPPFEYECVAVTMLNADAGVPGWHRIWQEYPRAWPSLIK